MVFGSTNGVAAKNPLSDRGIVLLIETLMVIKWFSSASGVLDCEGFPM